MVRAFDLLRVSPGRRDGYTGGVKQIWSSRGEGWGCHPGPSRERSAQTKEGFLRALLFLWPFGLLSIIRAVLTPKLGSAGGIRF
jgi:hypothetical protein